jgi:hypothetical protein
MEMREQPTEVIERRPLVRWGPAFAGAISAIALTTMVMSFWLAIGYGSNVTWFVDNMQWFFLGTALAGLLAGGMVAGRVAGIGGAAVGTVDGMMVWALAVLAALVPLSLRALSLANNGVPSPATRTAFGVSSGNMWALFGVLVGGLLCTLIGGAVGGAGRSRPIRLTRAYRREWYARQGEWMPEPPDRSVGQRVG